MADETKVFIILNDEAQKRGFTLEAHQMGISGTYLVFGKFFDGSGT